MNEKYSPKTTDELIAALADGEIGLCDCPELFAQLAAEPGVGRRVADQQRLREAVNEAICGPTPCCPDQLRAKLEAMCGKHADDSAPRATTRPAAKASPTAGTSPVLARITRWVPAAMAAVLLIAAGVVFSQASSITPQSPSPILSVSSVNTFASRHADCAMNPALLKNTDRFSDLNSVQALPGRISDYFQRSPDGMSLDLSRIGYDYQMTGVCTVPGNGSIHLVYRHHDHPERGISLWLRPDDGSLAIDPQRLYVEAGANLDHPVILWKANGMLYFLVGDSLQDAHDAVDELRQSA